MDCVWADSTCSHSLALIRVVQPHEEHSHPPPSPRIIRAPTSRSNSLDARTHRFNLLTPNKKKLNKKGVNHSRLSRSSVVWSHGGPPSNEPGPSFGRNTSFCTLYSAKPWRTVQLGFYSECQVHQSLGSSLQKSGIFSLKVFTVFSHGIGARVAGLQSYHRAFSCNAFSAHFLLARYLDRVHTCGLHAQHDGPQCVQARCVCSETGMGIPDSPKHSGLLLTPSSHTSSSTLIPGLLRKDEG